MSSAQLGDLLTAVYPISGGQAQLFERGLTVKGAADEVVVSFAFPMIGRPSLSTATAGTISPFGPEAITFGLGRQTLEQVTSLIQRALAGRVRLQPTRLATGQVEVTAGPSVLVTPEHTNGVGGVVIAAVFGISVTTRSLQDRQLYDVALLADGGNWRIVAPHAVYHRQTWTDFGIVEINDLHVARRIDQFRGILRQAGRAEAAQGLFNWNDRFRGFVRYANFLHGSGVLDVILAIGDVYDYIHEKDDDPAGGGNAEFLRQLILGQAPGPDFADVEELLVPIFMVPGNHDYRKHPYRLVFDITLDFQLFGKDLTRIKNFAAYNLLQADAQILTAALDGNSNTEIENLDMNTAAQMVEVDPNITAYRTFLADRRSYVVRLGRLRIAMLDSASDVGIVANLLDGFQGFLEQNEDQATFVGGNPNCEGVSDETLDMVTAALNETPDDSLFIVCVHAPLFNPWRDEYSYFLRETQRPAQRDQVSAFLARQGRNPVVVPSRAEEELARTHPLWFAGEGDHRPPTFVKRVDSQDLLDFGVSRGRADDLMRRLVGIGSRRPADLVLSGHTHNQNEFSVRRMITGELAYYFDFYTQNPARYYPTRFTTTWRLAQPQTPGAITFEPVVEVTSIETDPAVASDARPWKTPHGAFANQLQIPPYANPLSAEPDPRAWWSARRPLVLQTGALGPLASSEDFAGFRVLSVKNNVIERIFFVPIRRLEDKNFRLALDDAIRPDPGRSYRYLERSRPFRVPTAVGSPSGLVFPAAGVNNVIYRDEQGRLHEVWQTATASGTSNLNDLADHAIEAASDPTSYDDTTQGFQVVLYRGTDRHVHSLYWSTGAVRRDALSRTAGAPEAAGKPAGFIQRNGANMVVYRAANGHLQSLFWMGTEAPHNEDLTTLAHAPTAVGDPAPFLDTSTGDNIVAYRGTDGHIHTLFWSTGAVGHDDLSGVAGSPRATGDPAAYYISRNNTHQVTYRSSDGHLHELFWFANNPVSHSDLTVAAGAPPAVSDPATYYSAGTNTKHVVYRSTDGHLHDLQFAPGAFPTHVDITVEALAPLAEDKPAAFTIEGPNTQHVVYRGSDGQIHEIRQTPANGHIHIGLQSDWRWCNLCQGLFYGPGAASSRCPAGGRHATAAQSGSFNYTLSDEPGDASRQSEWRWCNRCQGLFFGPGIAASRCPAGAVHASAEQSGSANYRLTHGVADPARQSDWRWCNKCGGLFFGPHVAASRCPAGGPHAAPAQSGSVNYSILMSR